MKHQIHQLEIDHRRAFIDFCEISYDMIMDEDEIETGLVDASMFKCPKLMHKAFRDGHTALVCSSLMEEIERCCAATIPFVLIIRKNGDVWATISCDEIDF